MHFPVPSARVPAHSPSERSAVLPSASLSFRVLRCHSECFTVIPSVSEESGTREICAGTPQYTLSEASSGSISPRKCRDMRGRPSIYAFSGIIRAHISGMRVRWRSRHQNHRRRPDVRRTANKLNLYCTVSQWITKKLMFAVRLPERGLEWYSRSFADAQDDKSGCAQDDKSGCVQEAEGG